MEKWNKIPGYTHHAVSDHGRVKNLKTGNILKPNLRGQYPAIKLRDNGNVKLQRIHVLVAMTFLNHKPDGFKLVVNHKNNIKTDNRLVNLELIPNRENCMTHYKGTSKYKGVSWESRAGKWMAAIRIGNKRLRKRFIDEYEAHLWYQDKLKSIESQNVEFN